MRRRNSPPEEPRHTEPRSAPGISVAAAILMVWMSIGGGQAVADDIVKYRTADGQIGFTVESNLPPGAKVIDRSEVEDKTKAEQGKKRGAKHRSLREPPERPTPGNVVREERIGGGTEGGWRSLALRHRKKIMDLREQLRAEESGEMYHSSASAISRKERIKTLRERLERAQDAQAQFFRDANAEGVPSDWLVP